MSAEPGPSATPEEYVPIFYRALEMPTSVVSLKQLTRGLCGWLLIDCEAFSGTSPFPQRLPMK